MTHTPGPWKVGDTNWNVIAMSVPGAHTAGTMGRVFGYASSNNTVCLLDDGENIQYTDEAEMMANANLIAAAPDLLQACKALLTAMDEWSEDSLSPTNQEALLALMSEARSAITKATQEAK